MPTRTIEPHTCYDEAGTYAFASFISLRPGQDYTGPGQDDGRVLA